MKKIFKFIPYAILLSIVILIFKAWFLPGLITAGDLWPYSKLIYASREIIPYAWDVNIGDGMGSFVGPLLWIYLNFGIPTTLLGSLLGLSWSVIERVWYLFPFLIFSFYSSFRLFSKLFSKNNFSLLSASIFTLNSYILMVVGGGQVSGIGMAYSIFPLVLYFLIMVSKSIDKKNVLFYSVSLAFILSVQIIFDLRVAYISGVSIFLFWIFQIFNNKSLKFILRSLLYIFIIPGILSFLLNSFWIIPTIVNGRNPVKELGQAYSTLDAVKFFSFAKIENTMGLMHPNWPENIFGKVSFMRPEFLLLPLLAFSSLVFLKKEIEDKRKLILFFAALALLGIFLGKGANEPIGGLYLWLFDYFPGFIMFRDPTKWYIPIALSYSILIPYSAENIYIALKERFK